MFKFIFPAIMCVALCCPMLVSAQDCGCAPVVAPAPCCQPASAPCCEPAPAPCVKTRKRLKLVDTTREVCVRKTVCVTDECGCTKRKVVRVKECVPAKKLALVEVPVDPCKKGCLQKIGDRLANMRAKIKSAGCCAPAPCGCGCN